MWRYKSELWRRSGKSRAYKNYTRLPENKPATKDGDVSNQILTITDTSTTSVKVYVLRFGKAGWDCVLKGNIYSVFLCFIVFFLSRRKAPQRYVSQNLYLGIIYSLSIFTLYFSIRRGAWEFGFFLWMRSASLLINPVFTPGGWHKKKVRVLKGLCLFLMCLYVRGRFPLK